MNNNQTTLSAHLSELKKRLIYIFVFFIFAFAFSYYNAEIIYAFLLRPLKEAYANNEQHYMIYTGLTEAFFTYLKLSMFSAFMLTSPIMLMQFYIFIAPGLYKNEKSVILPYLISAPLLFLFGAAMVYYYIFPLAWKFFISFENLESISDSIFTIPRIKLEPRVSEYLSLVMQLIIAFGLAFQLPIILTILVRVAIISSHWLVKKRKFAIIIIFTISAILTPPDVISQIGLAIPMILLYELSILIARSIEKNREN